LYPFFAGLLLSRMVNPGRVKHAFPICSAIIVAVLVMPRIGGPTTLWMNGLYESLCIVLVFPLVVCLGASGELKSGLSARICTFLGNISYPIYIVHYPFIYAYTAWVQDHKLARRAPGRRGQLRGEPAARLPVPALLRHPGTPMADPPHHAQGRQAGERGRSRRLKRNRELSITLKSLAAPARVPHTREVALALPVPYYFHKVNRCNSL
ncbi:MAG TPA: acyltransferase, partial [Telluria sp.]